MDRGGGGGIGVKGSLSNLYLFYVKSEPFLRCSKSFQICNRKVVKSAPFFTVIVHLIVNSIHILMTKEKLSLLPKTESLDKEVGFVLIILGFFIDLQVRQSLLY